MHGAVIGAVGAVGVFVGTRFLPPLPGLSHMMFLGNTVNATCNQNCSRNNGCSYIYETFCVCATRCNGTRDEPDCAECNDADYVEDWLLHQRERNWPTYNACQCNMQRVCWANGGHYYRWTCNGCC